MASEDESTRKVNKAESRTVESPEAESDGAATGLDERLQAHIGGQLKSMYDSYLNAPIPDRLVELLEKLDQVSGHPAADGDPEAGR